MWYRNSQLSELPILKVPESLRNSKDEAGSCSRHNTMHKFPEAGRIDYTTNTSQREITARIHWGKTTLLGYRYRLRERRYVM